MSVDSKKRSDASPASVGSEEGLLLVRAPSDREIYGTFRALASRWRDEAITEQLLIEGNVPLTAGLILPSIPASLQRLLEADCEMIDLLALEVRDIKVTYVRSGGHAPFRESFFDELRIELGEGAQSNAGELASIFHELCSHLGVVSHSATPPFAAIIAEAIAKNRKSDDAPQSDTAATRSGLT